MYGSKTSATYARQEKKRNSFHLKNICRILGISWQDRVSNAEVLSRANLPSMFTLLRHRRLRWLGHVYRMENGRIQRHSLWRVGIWKENQRPPTAALQGCLQETWKHSTSTLSPGRALQPTAWGGEALWTNPSSQGKRSWWTQKLGKGPTERSATTPRNQGPNTNATFAAENVSPISVSTATSHAAIIKQTGQPGCTPMIKLGRRRPFYHTARRCRWKGVKQPLQTLEEDLFPLYQILCNTSSRSWQKSQISVLEDWRKACLCLYFPSMFLL